MAKKCATPLFIFLALCILFSANFTFAKTDLSISETDITFSKDEPLAGETIKIYARVFNTGDRDVTGFVVFSDNYKEIADPQPVSVKSNTYDDVFIDWKATEGKHNIKAVIAGTNPTDEIAENNSSVKKDFLVDIDTDKDGIRDSKDADDDNDGLADQQETNLGTDSLIADTDGDGTNDSADVFPKDETEWQDADKDGLGDNKDLDDDNDGVFDFEEIELGSNPLSADSDNDGINDQNEVKSGTNPVKSDTDGDKVNDLKDDFPLDASKWQAGLLGGFEGFFQGRESWLALGIPAVFILFLLFYRRRR